MQCNKGDEKKRNFTTVDMVLITKLVIYLLHQKIYFETAEPKIKLRTRSEVTSTLIVSRFFLTVVSSSSARAGPWRCGEIPQEECLSKK